MKLIERTTYLDTLKDVQGTPDIKIITGIRRSGKSKLMESFINYVKNNDNAANIIYVDLSDIQYEKLNDYHMLNNYITENYKKETNNYLFIDEVQMCHKFEITINSVHASGNYDIYITGSNAFLQSSDLATLFTGRSFSIDIFPFSFLEYNKYWKDEKELVTFDKYRIIGGMSGSYLYKSLSNKYKYLNDVFETLIIRDIIQKYNIRNSLLLEKLVDYLMDNISNITSPSKIANTLTSNNNKITDKTISKYIGYLCSSFGFYRIRRYDIKGKKYLTTNDKYYLADTSFRYARLGNKNLDFGRLTENIIAIELLRRGYEVYVGMLNKTEIDFVAIRQNEKIYIQVAEYIDNPETFAREYKPLLSIRDAYPKMILARTGQDTYQYEGIIVKDISKWLLE